MGRLDTLALHQSEKLEVLKGAAILNAALAAKMWR